jgi:putative membrane protein
MTTDRNELAEERTEYAEDRTLLANERTFSGWARTSMAAIGIGLGFNALFRTLEPSWVPKAIATLFIGLGIFLILAAERRAHGVKRRLNAHSIETVQTLNLKTIAVAISGGGLSLIAAIWVIV